MTEPKGEEAPPRRRRVVAIAAGVLAVAVGWVVFATVISADGPTDADREALRRAVATGGSENAYDAVVGLASDSDRWHRLVADGDPDLAELLDRAQPALGRSSNRATRAAVVVEPLLRGDTVHDDVLAPLARWTWPLLADPTVEVTPAVFDVAGRDDEHLEVIAQAMVLARLQVVLVADEVSFTRWERELRTMGSGSGASLGEIDSAGGGSALVPAPLIAQVLADWGRDDSGASVPLRERLLSIGISDPRGEVGGTETLLMAGHLRTIDDSDAVDTAAVLLGEVAGPHGDTLVGVLDHLMFEVDDPAVLELREDVRSLLDG